MRHTGISEGSSKSKVKSTLRENIYPRIQRGTQQRNALGHTTSPHSCESIYSIGIKEISVEGVEPRQDCLLNSGIGTEMPASQMLFHVLKRRK
ncbi:hypothetical protein AVEN_63871-1 [Araneus ventricosus]|uniref:Uncharacterized protein n=1 Tax=Araneus ventricosus TaxID=182803 RepID=A0A4Y2M305_ARAVE|nr:hypothetical protein AVEN_63871-1 [Araneus ventricosus]